jgi:hypothetical protein
LLLRGLSGGHLDETGVECRLKIGVGEVVPMRESQARL